MYFYHYLFFIHYYLNFGWGPLYRSEDFEIHLMDSTRKLSYYIKNGPLYGSVIPDPYNLRDCKGL